MTLLSDNVNYGSISIEINQSSTYNKKNFAGGNTCKSLTVAGIQQGILAVEFPDAKYRYNLSGCFVRRQLPKAFQYKNASFSFYKKQRQRACYRK